MFAVGDDLDFSDDAAVEAYLFETRGEGNLEQGLFNSDLPNGFAVGKKWMNVHIEQWKKDIRSGLVWRHELEEVYPEWFLDKFLGHPKQGWPINREQTVNLFRSVCVQEGVSERRDE